jgi:hypothetical protein
MQHVNNFGGKLVFVFLQVLVYFLFNQSFLLVCLIDSKNIKKNRMIVCCSSPNQIKRSKSRIENIFLISFGLQLVKINVKAGF